MSKSYIGFNGPSIVLIVSALLLAYNLAAGKSWLIALSNILIIISMILVLYSKSKREE